MASLEHSAISDAPHRCRRQHDDAGCRDGGADTHDIARGLGGRRIRGRDQQAGRNQRAFDG
jgi:hypothetical protein